MRRVLVCDDDVTISEVVAIILVDRNLAEVYTISNCDNIIEKIEPEFLDSWFLALDSTRLY